LGVVGDALLVGFDVPGVGLGAELGRGASTVVFRAVREDHEYAIKILNAAGDAAEAAAFRREAAMLAGLDDPGLIAVHEVGDAGGRPYLIMDLVEGRSLESLLQEGSAADVRDVRWVARMGLEVAGALAVAHRAGLVHRDVKPDNIMVRTDGRAQLIDFGLATRSGAAIDAAVGTFRYSAPEQSGMLHRAVDGRADLYGLGVVLFECLAGHAPFHAEDVGELIRLHLSAPVPDLPDVAPSIAAVVAKLMAKDPDDRYQSARGLAADLSRIAAGEREVFRLGGDDTAGGSDSELVGRADLLARLGRQWRRALTPTGSARGGLIVVVGAPGIGKSRLVRELTGTARAEDHLVLHGTSAEDDAVPLGPLRSLVDQHVAAIGQLSAAEQGPAVDQLRTAAGPTAALLGGFSPALAELLGFAELGAEVGHDAEERQFADAVGALLLGLAEAAGGAVLHLDNAQWWDEGTRRVLRQLAPRLRDSALLVVVTARDDPDNQPALAVFDSEFKAAVDLRLTVGPLDGAAVQALVTGQLGGGTVPPDLVALLAARSAGSPLAVAEYVRAITDAGLIRPYWGAWHLDAQGLDALALPENVMDLLVRRVDDLGGQGRELLTVAAAIGTRFHPDLVAGVAAADLDATLTLFAEATGHQLIEATSDGGFAFLHDRIRSALLDGLEAAGRRALHQRIAETMDSTTGPEQVYVLARQYLAGEPDRSPAAAFRAVSAAGVLALAEHALADAVDYLTRAAAIADPAGIVPGSDFHVGFGAAAIKTGHYATGEAQLELALQTERDPLRRAGIYRLLAKSHQMRWSNKTALEIIQLGLAEVGGRLPRNPVVLIVTTVVNFVAGVLVRYLPARLRFVHGAAARSLEIRADLLCAAGVASGLAQRYLESATAGLRCLLPANRVESDRTRAETRIMLAAMAAFTSMPRLAERHIALAIEAAARTGDPQLVARVAFMRGGALEGGAPIGPDTGRIMLWALDRHGHMIDSGDLLNMYGLIGQVGILRGYQADVAEWYRRGMAAVDRPEEGRGGNFATIGAQAAALGGQPALAAARLREVRDYVATLEENRSQGTNLAMVAIHLAVEEGETEAELDRILDEFAALRLSVVSALPTQRPIWVYQAFGRLAQLAAAGPEQRAERQAQTTMALRALKKPRTGRCSALSTPPPRRACASWTETTAARCGCWPASGPPSVAWTCRCCTTRSRGSRHAPGRPSVMPTTRGMRR
jgi:tRNA A-37 threonylcarbamoyl transferase component Bud32